MLRLMKKNAIHFIQHSISIMALMTLYWFLVRKELSGAMVLFQGLWLILAVVSALSVNEKIEEKSQGYNFLKSLPLKDREIVLSKFSLVLLTTALLVAYNYILYLFFPGPAHLYTLGRVFVFLSAIFAIVLAGISYIIIFRFGHAVFVKFVWATMIITMVSPILVFEFVISKMDMDVSRITERLSQVNGMIWILILSGGLMIYYLLMQTAIKAKQASRG
jgi:hypothetical protein